jgi:hypothetical protein
MHFHQAPRQPALLLPASRLLRGRSSQLEFPLCSISGFLHSSLFYYALQINEVNPEFSCSWGEQRFFCFDKMTGPDIKVDLKHRKRFRKSTKFA